MLGRAGLHPVDRGRTDPDGPDAASLGHINERACTRWLDHSPGDPEWERMAAPFGESVAEPLTCQTIEELLEAVS